MNMPPELILHFIALLIWVTFIIYWAVSAIGVKKNIQGSSWGRSFVIRILLIIIILQFLQATSFAQFLDIQFSYGLQVVGVIILAAGVAFAIWARRHLGRDWSGTPSMKEGHELVTSGPYRFVRHPIYTGITVAFIGSALVNGFAWIIIFVIFTALLLFRIPKEEGYMMQLFPDRYPEYKRRTKALIPFVW